MESPTPKSFEQQVLERLDRIDTDLSRIETKLSNLDAEFSGLKKQTQDWQGWLRLTSGTIVFTIGVSFLGILLGVLIPIGIALWRQSLA